MTTGTEIVTLSVRDWNNECDIFLCWCGCLPLLLLYISNISHSKLQYSLFSFQMKLWTVSLFWEKWRRLVSPPTTSTLLQFKWRKWLTSSLGVTSVRIPSCRNPFQFFIRSQQGMFQSPEFCITFFFFFLIVVVCVFILSKSLRWA